ncbi:MAG: MarR family transcriptional regulator [Acidimicrobiales bacterium]|nr:MarR family transcriptional regulator [Acidimicrobiales bacterium]
MKGQTAGEQPFVISVFRLASVARRSFAGRMAEEHWAKDAGMRQGCFAVLRTVAAHPGSLSQRDLSVKLGIDPSDIVGLVDDLERAGYLARRRDATDRRRYALDITTSGHDALGRFNRVAEASSEAVLAGLSALDRAELARLLGLVLASDELGTVVS